LASVDAVKGGNVEDVKIVYRIATLHCWDPSRSFQELCFCPLYVLHVLCNIL